MPSGLNPTPPRIIIGVLTAILLTIIIAPTSSAQVPDLIITVGDTIGDPGEKNSVVTVFLDNLFDTVAAFELWLRIGNPEILEFRLRPQRVRQRLVTVAQVHRAPYRRLGDRSPRPLAVRQVDSCRGCVLVALAFVAGHHFAPAFRTF